MYACSVLFLVLFHLSSLLAAFVSVLKSFLLSSSVKQTTGKDSDGSLVSCSLPLAVKPLEKSPTYDIAEEDPFVYSDEDDFDVGFV